MRKGENLHSVCEGVRYTHIYMREKRVFLCVAKSENDWFSAQLWLCKSKRTQKRREKKRRENQKEKQRVKDRKA